MSIHTVCPNGHKLKIKNKYAGKLGSCPKCGVQVRVPFPDGESGEFSFSGESIKMVRPPEAEYSPPAKADEVVKNCVTCSANLPPDMAVCPHCGTSIATLAD